MSPIFGISFYRGAQQWSVVSYNQRLFTSATKFDIICLILAPKMQNYIFCMCLKIDFKGSLSFSLACSRKKKFFDPCFELLNRYCSVSCSVACKSRLMLVENSQLLVVPSFHLAKISNRARTFIKVVILV